MHTERTPIRLGCRLLGILLILSTVSLSAATPEWLWLQKTPGTDVRYFRKEFVLIKPPTKAILAATGDDSVRAYINGKRILDHTEWSKPAQVDITSLLTPGTNVVALMGRNEGDSPGAVMAKIDITTDTSTTAIVTDTSWRASVRDESGWNQKGFDVRSWSKPVSLGKHGTDPWGEVFASSSQPAKPGAPASPTKREATPAESLFAPPGFKVELIHTSEGAEGSWVAITKDPKGRLIISPQHGRGAESAGGLLRITLSPQGQVLKREFIAQPLFDAQGLTFAHDSIYAVVNKYSTHYKSGLYRIQDKAGNDRYEDIQLIKEFDGGGEHGPHAVELGPDGMIYVMCGNHTKVPASLSPTSPHKNYQEDHVLPRQWDGNGHAAGILAPGGYIARTDKDGTQWELFCAGFRNQYDFAFNVDGELFTYDSDMEWDWGMPWYRPTRVNHCVSAGEYGWRSGTGKWPTTYPDSLPAIDIGVGCPTGVATGKGARFPAKYQRALYIMDWTYGRLMAVHLTPDGASYKGSFENFICPLGLVQSDAAKKPLNVTDLTIGDDGAMYFTIGGRGVQSGLYRVSYTGSESTAPATTPNRDGSKARVLRHKLEAFHGKSSPEAVRFAWPYLNHADRFIRYAARIAIESQPVDQWRALVFSENRLDAAQTARLALARLGAPSDQPALLQALASTPWKTMSEPQKYTHLRTIMVSIARMGKPGSKETTQIIETLNPLFPTANEMLDRELAQVLIALDAPQIVSRCLKILQETPSQETYFHYLFHLRTARTWTLEERKSYFAAYSRDRSSMSHQGNTAHWFKEAGRTYADGASMANFIKNFMTEAVKNLNAAEKEALATQIASLKPAAAPAPKVQGPHISFPPAQQRSHVQAWTRNQLRDLLPLADSGRNFERGRQAFVDSQCILCHKMGNAGGGVGPDLTAIGSRFSRGDMLDSIIDPSAVVSEQYQNTSLTLKDGDEVSGRLVDENGDNLVLVPNQLTPETKVTVAKSQVSKRTFSKLSPMPEGLINILSKEEILDLLAFMESGGNKNHPAFR